MELNSEEKAALNKKMENPNAFVKCPRCGAEIKFIEIGNSGVIKCATEGCIKTSFRGI